MDAKPKEQEPKAFTVTIGGQSFACNPMPPADGQQWTTSKGESVRAEIVADDEAKPTAEE